MYTKINIVNRHSTLLRVLFIAVLMLIPAFITCSAQKRIASSADGVYAYDFQVFFPVNVSTLEKDYLSNAKTFAILDSILAVHGTLAVDTVRVIAQSSPEGPSERNISLARDRAAAMSDYLVASHPDLQGKIITSASVARWPRKGHSLKRLRYAAFRLEFPYDITAPILPFEAEIDESFYLPVVVEDGPFVFDESPISVSIPSYVSGTAGSHAAKSGDKVPVTIAALKTNLLYDALTVYNVELEVPVADRWSVVVEDVFPWWEYSFRWCLQMWELGVEGRFWFTPWEKRGADKLKGFFAGAYGMSAKYDFQWNTDIDYQGEYWSAGVSGGYSLPVGASRKCRLEFSLGLGFLHTDWRHYYPTDAYDKLIRDKANSGIVDYWGPTKAKVSLVIPINVKLPKKEVRND